jgi:hypothetical protein
MRGGRHGHEQSSSGGGWIRLNKVGSENDKL